jgi:hypothetical protein
MSLLMGLLMGLLMRLHMWICDSQRWSQRLLWLSRSSPGIKDLLHKLHPFWWSASKVVLDGTVPESDKVMLLVVW